MDSQRCWDYLLGAIVAGLGIAAAHYIFHWHD